MSSLGLWAQNGAEWSGRNNYQLGGCQCVAGDVKQTS